ncbi:MAG: hypothetical protein U0787_09425 [Polyangia bacterium]
MRARAETVFRRVRRDKSQTAVHLVSRLLSELDLQQKEASESEREQRAYLLNLRGVIYAQRNQEQTALADLTAANQQSPQWAVPLYNLGLCHKKARRWAEMTDVLSQALAGLRRQAGRLTSTSALAQGSHLSRSVLWNLGLSQTALGKLDEARSCWQACGLLSGRPGGASDLGLAQLSLPTTGPYSVERVWVQRVDPVRARILSVVRYGAACQFGDVVLCDTQGQGNFYDGLTGSDGDETLPEESANGLLFIDPIESAGYALHVVQGPSATPSQAMSLTERLREHGLHIEVWSLTMRLPGSSSPPEGEDRSVPLCAGLVIPAGPMKEAVPLGPIRLSDGEIPSALLPNDAQRTAEKAVAVLNNAARDLGLSLYAPSLMDAAGDELGAARHRRALRRSSPA